MTLKVRLKRLFSVATLVAACVWLVPGFATPAMAQLKGTQTEGTIAPIPIAIPTFLGDDSELASRSRRRRRG